MGFSFSFPLRLLTAVQRFPLRLLKCTCPQICTCPKGTEGEKDGEQGGNFLAPLTVYKGVR
jgi:hypothetical protein